MPNNIAPPQIKYDVTVPRNLEVTLYGDLEPINDALSKCRVRIFYKGLNRNRTYISEDFANQLIASLPYTPIKGIFNHEDTDFEDHGEKNSDGKIYGVVMAEPNVAWESHLDSDGQTRIYACADVLLYTSLYSEAKLIPSSSQSMEINPYTFEGEWKIWEDGQPYYEFTKGSLFGLQVLGMATEPCFEGASFYYSLIKDDLQGLIDYVKQINKEEESKKVKIDYNTLFRLSDQEKARKIFEALNPDVEDYEDIEYFVEAVYDDYAVCRKRKDKCEKFVRVYYSKNEDDTITIGEKIDCKIVDVTETEAKALEAMKTIGQGSYEMAEKSYNDLVEKNTELENSLAAANTSLTEANDKISTMESEYSVQKVELESKISEKDAKLTEALESYTALESEKVKLENEKNDLINEKEELASFKKQVEIEKKEEILFKYAEHLTDSIIESLKESIDKYSIEDFKKEVCTAAVENDPTLFSKNNDSSRYYTGKTSDDSKSLSGLERILNKYKNGGNK